MPSLDESSDSDASPSLIMDDHYDANNDDNAHPNIDNDNDAISVGENDLRQGTLTSARFNILSTMVGGGSLSLPLAFHQAGNSLLAPILLIFFSILAKSSVDFLISAAILSQPQSQTSSSNPKKGYHSFDSVACAAFGQKAKLFCMALLSTICFITIVGYGVLLRDMLLPLSDYIFGSNISNDGGDHGNDDDGPTFFHNITMLAVVLIVTPLCTLRDLTPLEKVGALSMASIFTVACCIAYRSIQCNFSSQYDDVRLMPWYQYMNFLPASLSSSWSWSSITASLHDVLNAMPILLNVFMCHFNVLPVHNELQNPSSARINKLFSSSMYGACLFYLFVGFTGSMYGNCTPDGAVEGNVLLSFEEDDILLMVARACLSLTITFAFPILVVPCRDVFLRAFTLGEDGQLQHEQTSVDGEEAREGCECALSEGGERAIIGTGDDMEDDNDLAQPLLLDSVDDSITRKAKDQDHSTDANTRRLASVAIFWTGAITACCVKSIDIVWDILGGSLSIMMGFLIPCGSYIVLMHMIWSRDGIGADDCCIEESSYSVAEVASDRQRPQNSSTENLSRIEESCEGTYESAINGTNTIIPNSTRTTELINSNTNSEDSFNQEMEQYQRSSEEVEIDHQKQRVSYFLIALFLPMMFILTGNAIYNLSHGE